MNTKPCTKKTCLSSWLREDVEGKEEERERMNEETKKKERKYEKRGGVRKGKDCDENTLLDRLSYEVFEYFSLISEVESVGDSFGFGVCACCASVCA